ncbi:hypothetical protein SAMN05660297_03412 [Natronincola peptidivorans]|uniref:Probable membrane transporter protein n=1 Tax=Natronincola peptidivorans TaxID=426128 RepID=A0A1I0GXT0_9FIRM|nr:sulfite exporter TauE/SafE family protein [Natronincola peptidivorans]SET76000.1 hypothetical protein SAMN05660297_03412 [Natronincola peptidivorans]
MEELLTQLIIGTVVILLASTIQGITSFGFSLIALPLLGMILPLKVVVPVLIIFSLVLNSIILYHIKEYVDFKRISILVAAGIVATPFGTYLLKVLDESFLNLLVGIIITFAAIINFYGVKIKVNNEKLSYIPVGLISGLLNGSVSLGGPPIVLFLTYQAVEKQIFRANLTLYFWILNIITIPTYYYNGLITHEVIQYTAYLFPILIAGTLLGIKLGNRVDENLFKKFTLSLIMVMGALSIISGIA